MKYIVLILLLKSFHWLTFCQSTFGDKLTFYIFVTVELCRVVSVQMAHQVLPLLRADIHLILSQAYSVTLEDVPPTKYSYLQPEWSLQLMLGEFVSKVLKVCWFAVINLQHLPLGLGSFSEATLLKPLFSCTRWKNSACFWKAFSGDKTLEVSRCSFLVAAVTSEEEEQMRLPVAVGHM